VGLPRVWRDLAGPASTTWRLAARLCGAAESAPGEATERPPATVRLRKHQFRPAKGDRAEREHLTKPTAGGASNARPAGTERCQTNSAEPRALHGAAWRSDQVTRQEARGAVPGRERRRPALIMRAAAAHSPQATCQPTGRYSATPSE